MVKNSHIFGKFSLNFSPQINDIDIRCNVILGQSLIYDDTQEAYKHILQHCFLSLVRK